MQILSHLALFILAWVCLAAVAAAGFAWFFSLNKRRAKAARQATRQNLLPRHQQKKKLKLQYNLRLNSRSLRHSRVLRNSHVKNEHGQGQIIDFSQRNMRKKAY